MTTPPSNENPYGYSPYPAMGTPGVPPPSMVPPPAVPQPAVRIPTMWRRLGARLLDGLVVTLMVLLTIGAVVGVLIAVYADRLNEPEPPVGFIVGVLLGYLVAVLAAVAYEVGFIAKRGATPGKALLGMRVVRVDTLRNPGTGAALLRWLVPFVVGIVLPLSILVYVSPWFDGTKWLRGWHDKAAGVLVTRTR